MLTLWANPRLRLRASAALPLLAFAAFLALQADARAGELQDGPKCTYASKQYPIGACEQNGCWWWEGQRCITWAGNGVWDACGTC